MSLRRILVILDSPPKYGYYCDYIYPVTGSDGRRAPKRHGTPVQNDQNIQNSPTRPWSRPCSLSAADGDCSRGHAAQAKAPTFWPGPSSLSWASGENIQNPEAPVSGSQPDTLCRSYRTERPLPRECRQIELPDAGQLYFRHSSESRNP